MNLLIKHYKWQTQKNLTWGSKEWQDVLAWWTSWCNKPSNLKWKSLKWNWQNIHKNTEKVFIVSSKKMKTSFKYKCISSPKIKKPHHFFYLLVNTLSSHFSIQTSQNLILSVVLMSIRFDLRAHEIDLVLWGFFPSHWEKFWVAIKRYISAWVFM